MNACASSPDGVFALLDMQEDGLYEFIGVCVLEIKTRSALGTVDDLYRHSMGCNTWSQCSTGTRTFKEVIPDAAYHSQLCQHATALGLARVLIVFGLPGGLPMKMTLVTVSNEHQHTLLTLQKLLAEK